MVLMSTAVIILWLQNYKYHHQYGVPRNESELAYYWHCIFKKNLSLKTTSIYVKLLNLSQKCHTVGMTATAYLTTSILHVQRVGMIIIHLSTEAHMPIIY